MIPIAPEWMEELRHSLLAWFQQARREMPWRGSTDPYAIWVSEIMLQQTQVATVIPFFQRFIERFPTVESLASAPLEEVLKLWEGLGYYSRARNLRQAAQVVMEQHGGQLPNSADRLRELPGIGAYTAGAIASIAFQKPEPLVDGNVMRVLSRLLWIQGDLKKGANQSLLWQIAGQLVPEDSPGDFNQALMELGSTICSPADPACARCPVSHLCAALKRGEPTAVPEASASKSSQAVTDVSAMVWNGTAFILAQRPEQGLWGGLWEFPRLRREGRERVEQTAQRAALELAGIQAEPRSMLEVVKHQVTYHAIKLHGCLCDYQSGELRTSHYTQARWVEPGALSDYPLSAPQRLLAQAAQRWANGQPVSLFS
ncbi:MAG: A/G-specific adenine glycosylase [Fimbriimonadia bacterium]|nr:A/G-specific adenine glycosylase [Fimbriimonadia bacterium]